MVDASFQCFYSDVSQFFDSDIDGEFEVRGFLWMPIAGG